MSVAERRLAVLGPHLYEGVPLTRAAAAAGVPLRTAQRWLAGYQAGGAAALSRAGRADRGGRRFPAELVQLVEGMALRRPPPKLAQLHRAVAAVSEQRGWAAPSYSTVRSIVAAMDAGMAVLAQRGSAGYRDRFELVMRREASAPNDVWQVDHTQLDLLIVDERGRAVRPWLTVVLDDRSRAVAGYAVFLGAPSAVQTALALRQAIWRKDDAAWPVCGLPATLYSDNGADFTSEHIAQVCADTRVQLIHSTPGVPQGRGKIERFFGTITSELLPTLPGHLPHGSNGRPVTAPALSLHQLDSVVGRFVTDNYHQRVHPKTGQTPAQRWTAGGWLPRMPDSLEQLDLLLLTVATPRVVHRDGIRCHGLRYMDLALAAYVGEQVTIRYDPRDLAEIRVFHRGQFICRAVAPELAAATISLKDLQTTRARRRRQLQHQLQHRRSLVDTLTYPVWQDVPDETPTTARIPPAPTAAATGRTPRTTLRLYRED
ncbi:Mu transposase C-terminal domain-containing protein [Nakamurella endophytica]|uniref:Transposase n=1 Tax=Nakamurella endophytica TaxID=1748367 RepID=A0A917WJE2_9ACTN|nr:Mu transposase C-terminal domain-containing protein [Nakamurella endophytica]GGM09474.1 transposase [Nakamurella endophytica]